MHFSSAWLKRTGQLTLRISVNQNPASIAITLEGRIAGLWAEELGRTWTELAPTRGQRKFSIDLSNATYADATGLRILREIHEQTGAELLTSSPWTKYLAEEVTRTNRTQKEEL